MKYMEYPVAPSTQHSLHGIYWCNQCHRQFVPRAEGMTVFVSCPHCFPEEKKAAKS